MHCYQHDARRLLVLGYNATLTVATEAPRGSIPKRTFDQMQARCLLCVASSATLQYMELTIPCHTRRSHVCELGLCWPRAAHCRSCLSPPHGHETLLLRQGCRGSVLDLSDNMSMQAMSRVSPTSLNSVKVLCEHQSTTVIIFSGSAKVHLMRCICGNALSTDCRRAAHACSIASTMLITLL